MTDASDQVLFARFTECSLLADTHATIENAILQLEFDLYFNYFTKINFVYLKRSSILIICVVEMPLFHLNVTRLLDTLR